MQLIYRLFAGGQEYSGFCSICGAIGGKGEGCGVYFHNFLKACEAQAVMLALVSIHLYACMWARQCAGGCGHTMRLTSVCCQMENRRFQKEDFDDTWPGDTMTEKKYKVNSYATQNFGWICVNKLLKMPFLVWLGLYFSVRHDCARVCVGSASAFKAYPSPANHSASVHDHVLALKQHVVRRAVLQQDFFSEYIGEPVPNCHLDEAELRTLAQRGLTWERHVLTQNFHSWIYL